MKHTTTTAMDMITNNGGNVGAGAITMKSPGIKVLGAIDYLVRVKKFRWDKK